MKGKFLCPAGCQNSLSRITEAKKILKSPRPAGSWRPLKCIFSGKGKSRSQRAANPRSGVILTEEKDSTQRAGSPALSVLCTEKPDRGSLRQLQSKFLPRCQNPQFTEQVSTTVPKSAILRFCPSRETCWGVPSPNPAMAACAAKIFPFGRPFFCENCPGNT